MGAKRYHFYISNPELQKTLDALKKHRLLSDLIEEALQNGLNKQIKRRLRELEKLGSVYKKNNKKRS